MTTSDTEMRKQVIGILKPTKNMLRIQLRAKDKSGKKWVDQFFPYETFVLAPSDETIDKLVATLHAAYNRGYEAAKEEAIACAPEKQDEHPTEDGVPVEVYGYEATYNQAIDAYKQNIGELGGER